MDQISTPPAQPPQPPAAPQPVPVIPIAQAPTPEVVEPPQRKSPWLMIISIIVLLGLLIGGYLWWKSTQSTKKSSQQNSVALVECTSTINTQPTTLPGYITKLYAGKMVNGTASVVDNGTRTFSLKGILAKTNASDIYFGIAKTSKETIFGTRGLIELCNANNQTRKGYSTKDTTTIPASRTAIAAYYYMHGGTLPAGPGSYRVDAYANVDGTWKLVGRMTGVTITD